MRKERILWTITYIACIAVLIWPALYNGYPILYSDTGTYVISGMRLETPIDRPITYGLFIRITSIGGFTLWTTIASQAAIITSLLHGSMGLFVPEGRHRRTILLATVIALSVFTSLPWVISQVMADIFTPMLVLTALLLFIPNQPAPSRTGRLALHVLFFLAAASHLSHPVFVVLLVGTLVLVRWLLQRWTGARISARPLWLMLASAALAYPIMSSAIAKTGNVMFMGALVQHGLAKEFLDARCGEERYELCAWKDQLPRMGYQFLWDRSGPTGGMQHWPAVRDEYGRIIRASFLEGRFLLRHLQVSIRATLDQLQLNDIGDGWGSFRAGSDVHYVLSRHMRHDMRTMEASRQYKSRLDLVPLFIPIHAWVIRISLLAIILLMWLSFRRRSGTLLATALTVMAAILFNAWGSSTFSGEIDRFGCKMIWMLPLLAILGMLHRRWAQQGFASAT